MKKCTNAYRFSFNGKENDNEVKGIGNFQDYGMRNFDNRLCRFLRVDPATKKYPELSSYQFASNSPISGIDLDGLELAIIVKQLYSSTMSNQQVYSFDIADERSAYEDVVKSFCAINNMDPSTLPSDRILSIEYDYTDMQNNEPAMSYAWSAKETEISFDTRSFKEKFIGAVRAKEDSYEGIGGFNYVLKDVKDVAVPIFKTIGLIQMAVGNVAGGIVTLEGTESVSNLIDGVLIGREFLEGNSDDAFLTMGAKVGSKIINSKLEKSGLDIIQKNAGKVGSDIILEKGSESLKSDKN